MKAISAVIVLTLSIASNVWLFAVDPDTSYHAETTGQDFIPLLSK